MSDAALLAPTNDPRDRATGAGVSGDVLLHGLAQHHAYHGGQIALLKKAAEGAGPSCRRDIIRAVMHASIACSLSLAAVLASSSAVAQERRPDSGDDAAVRKLVAQYVDARERRYPRAIGALFTDDADQFTTAGEWRRGREAIVRGTLESSQRNAGTRQIAVESVRFPARDVAIADGGYRILSTQGGATRQMWTTLVLTRQPDGWRIAAIRNALPTNPPPPQPSAR